MVVFCQACWEKLADQGCKLIERIDVPKDGHCRCGATTNLVAARAWGAPPKMSCEDALAKAEKGGN